MEKANKKLIEIIPQGGGKFTTLEGKVVTIIEPKPEEKINPVWVKGDRDKPFYEELTKLAPKTSNAYINGRNKIEVWNPNSINYTYAIYYLRISN